MFVSVCVRVYVCMFVCAPMLLLFGYAERGGDKDREIERERKIKREKER